MKINGNIISGEFDEQMNEFTIESVKHHLTTSTLRKTQIVNLYDYLNQHKGEADGQVLTLYDQLPVHLNQEETNQLLADLDKIKTYYQ